MRDLLLKHGVAAGASWTGQHALYGGTSTLAIYLSYSRAPLRCLPFCRFSFLASPVAGSTLPRLVNLDPGNAAKGGRAEGGRWDAKGV